MKGKYIKLTKLEDLKFEGFHPNGVNVGNTTIQGICIDEPKIGESLFLHSGLGYSQCWTSKVVSFDKDEMLLTTKNSIYKIEIHEE